MGVPFPTVDMGYEVFCERVKSLTSIDIYSYKKRQMERRLKSVMAKERVEGYADFYRCLKRDPEMVRRLVEFLPINVSEFFRNPDKFEYLASTVLPALLEAGRPLRIWSAACCNGAEPYSVAMLLNEAGSSENHYLLGTDIDEDALAEAGDGLYGQGTLKNITKARLTKYFQRKGEMFRVSPKIRERVIFRRHDLLSDPYETWDLILCRNVIIYFTEEARERVLRSLASALVPGGILFLGCTETITNPMRLGFQSPSPFFYRKMSGKS